MGVDTCVECGGSSELRQTRGSSWDGGGAAIAAPTHINDQGDSAAAAVAAVAVVFPAAAAAVAVDPPAASAAVCRAAVGGRVRGLGEWGACDGRPHWHARRGVRL